MCDGATTTSLREALPPPARPSPTSLWGQRLERKKEVKTVTVSAVDGGGVMACSLGGNNGSNAFQGREGEGEGESERRTKMGAITISSNKQGRRGEERRGGRLG